MTGAVRREEATAARGARWITIAMVVVGLLNYGYALLLTRLLDVAGYASFAGSQGLILWASTVATVSVPWVLAQALVRARSSEERTSAIRFAKMASAGGGAVAAAVVGGIAIRFASPAMTLVVAVSTFVIFLGTTTIGWLPGPGADADPSRPVHRGQPGEEHRRAAHGRGCPVPERSELSAPSVSERSSS